MSFPNGELPVLVLQGGGALGAYQAGAFEALQEAGYCPGWVAGISIGVINAAIICGNPTSLRGFVRLIGADCYDPSTRFSGGQTCGIVGPKAKRVSPRVAI